MLAGKFRECQYFTEIQQTEDWTSVGNEQRCMFAPTLEHHSIVQLLPYLNNDDNINIDDFLMPPTTPKLPRKENVPHTWLHAHGSN